MLRKLVTKIRGLRGPKTVEKVDVRRFCGTWYEIASVPNREERDCAAAKAEYRLDARSGRVLVRNSCLRKGKERSIRATAKPVPGTGNARLVVTFFRFIKAELRVIGLADDYSWAVVTNGDASRYWALSRTPYPDERVYLRMLETLKEKGLDDRRMVRTRH